MTILRYITQDGRLIEEKTKINHRYIEERDGFHPMTNDCVFQDSRRRRDSSILLVEGVTPPFGSRLGHEDMENFFREYIVAEQGLRQPTVSKMWWRFFERAGAWMASNGILLLIGLFILGMVAYEMFGGA